MQQKTIQSIERAVAALRAAGESSGGLRLSELADAIGMKPSATCHIVNTLVETKMLQKQNGRIVLGRLFQELAQQQQADRISELGKEFLPDFLTILPFARFVCFGLPREEGLFWAWQVTSNAPGRLQRPDCILSPFASAAGLMDAAMRDAVFAENLESRKPFAEYGTGLWKNRDAYRDFLAEARKKGYAVCPFDTEVLFKVSAPIFDRDGSYRAILGFGISAQESAVDPSTRTRAIELLLKTRDRLQKKFCEI